MPQVGGADAVVDKRAMVVHLEDAALADAAVVSLRGLEVLAVPAERVVLKGAARHLLPRRLLPELLVLHGVMGAVRVRRHELEALEARDLLRGARRLPDGKDVVEVDVDGEDCGQEDVEGAPREPRDDEPDAEGDDGGDEEQDDRDGHPREPPVEPLAEARAEKALRRAGRGGGGGGGRAVSSLVCCSGDGGCTHTHPAAEAAAAHLCKAANLAAAALPMVRSAVLLPPPRCNGSAPAALCGREGTTQRWVG